MNRAGFGCDSMHRQGGAAAGRRFNFYPVKGHQLLLYTMDGEAERVLQRVAR